MDELGFEARHDALRGVDEDDAEARVGVGELGRELHAREAAPDDDDARAGVLRRKPGEPRPQPGRAPQVLEDEAVPPGSGHAEVLGDASEGEEEPVVGHVPLVADKPPPLAVDALDRGDEELVGRLDDPREGHGDVALVLFADRELVELGREVVARLAVDEDDAQGRPARPPPELEVGREPGVSGARDDEDGPSPPRDRRHPALACLAEGPAMPAGR
ncbi:MAG: hypothetical protein IRZ11_03735 [Clostridia bacterium]|nr:hypothetical protein [Clostridia bacterium]